MTNLLHKMRNSWLRKDEAKKSIHELTSSEKEVIKLLSLGHSAKEIAEILSLSVLTVNTHLHNIYQKIGVRSATQAVRYYIFAEYGLIDLEADYPFLKYV